jgi:hypothetical protein
LGAARATCVMPMMPPAPAWFSTTTVCRNDSDSSWPMRRARMSLPEPGAKGTMKRISALG